MAGGQPRARRRRSVRSPRRSRGAGRGRRSWPAVGWVGDPLAGAVRRARGVAGARGHLQHRVRTGPRPAAREPCRHQPRRADTARPRHRRSEGSAGSHRSSPRRRSGASCSASPRPAATWRPCAPRRRRSTAAGGSTGRRCGPRTPSSPAGASASPAPTPTPAKHAGISCFAVDMTAPGVEIRPLVQITGEAEFNEVFLSDVFVPADHFIGELHTGWSVANTTLAHERGTTSRSRSRWSTRRSSRSCSSSPSPTVRSTTPSSRRPRAGIRRAADPAPAQLADALPARARHRTGTGVELGEVVVDRHDPAPVGDGVCGSPATPRAVDGRWARQWLWSGAAWIAGGTSEVQRTIIGERLLGLPRG